MNGRDLIAIPTFERPEALAACAGCLADIDGLARWRVFVRDDASTSLSVDGIAALLPEAERIDRNEVNRGPNVSQMALFRDCLDAGARRVLVIDSDMIVSPSILRFAEEAFARTDGFLGLYNSVNHPTVAEVDGDLVEKASFGGAATMWSADLLRKVVARCDAFPAGTWDDLARMELGAEGRRILVSKRSWAQHVGIGGTNNGRFGEIDYGEGFVIETDRQARFMAEAFERLMLDQRRFVPPPRKPTGLRGLVARLVGRAG